MGGARRAVADGVAGGVGTVVWTATEPAVVGGSRSQAAEVLEARVLLAGQPVVIGEVTPDIYSGGTAYFAGGASQPLGRYEVAYVNGALKLSPRHGYTTKSGGDGYHAVWTYGPNPTNADLPGAYILRNPETAGIVAGWQAQGQAEAATRALRPLDPFYHRSGSIIAAAGSTSGSATTLTTTTSPARRTRLSA